MANQSIQIHITPIESKLLSGAGYDLTTQILAVQFPTGHIYHYANVPYETAEAFMEAESKGKYYLANIKGHFDAAKMTGACTACGVVGRLLDTCEDCGCGTYEEKKATKEK